MAIPASDWIHYAKRQPVGGTDRFSQHGDKRHSRPNLVVGNDADKYWCYCNSCKEGGVVIKEHVVITGRAAPKESHLLTLPHDLTKVLESEPSVQAGVYGFLASKNMDAQYLPELWFSKSRCRVMFMHGMEWLGRDTTNNSPQKWLTFNGSNHLHGELRRDWPAVVVEDPFSFYKARWALRDMAVSVYSSLGTKMSDALMVKLLQHSRVDFFYDDDPAGHKGADTESKRLKAFGIISKANCAVGGDPKDMTVLAIQQHVMRFNGHSSSPSIE